jgi:hypothetical protein
MRLMVLVAFGSVLLASCGGEPDVSSQYRAELSEWKSFCGHAQTTFAKAVDEESDGRSSDLSHFILDDYVLTAANDKIPSSARTDVADLRRLTLDRRAGRIDAATYRADSRASVGRLDHEVTDGACAYLREQA